MKNLCKSCKEEIKGQCCLVSIFYKGEVYGLKAVPCKYLTKSKQCKVYKNRFEKCTGCLTIDKAIKMRALPQQCQYVKDIPNYKGKKIAKTKEEEKMLLKYFVEYFSKNLDVKIPDYINDKMQQILIKGRKEYE